MNVKVKVKKTERRLRKGKEMLKQRAIQTGMLKKLGWELEMQLLPQQSYWVVFELSEYLQTRQKKKKTHFEKMFALQLTTVDFDSVEKRTKNRFYCSMDNSVSLFLSVHCQL